MAHGPTKFPSWGRCIYCGTSDSQLTDEHVVPYSLGGQHILVKASCLQCADITKQFEQRVARDLWGDARSSYDAPTRRRNERNREFQLKHPTNNELVLNVSASDYPAAMVFYFMGRAGILRGDPDSVDRSGDWTLKAIVDESRLQKFEKCHPGRLTAQFRHVPDAFGRLLAKIGYCQVLTSLSPDAFTPICLPYILGAKTNLSHIVGGRGTTEEPEANTGYRINSNRFGTCDKQVLVAEVRLMANNHTPTYHVVVGYVAGVEKASVIIRKLDARWSVDMPDRFEPPHLPPDELHWMPDYWPLPLFLNHDAEN